MRSMADTEYVHVETTTPLSTRVTARHHTFVVDKPPSSGGADGGPMASEYFLAALASCQITTAHKIAAKRRKPLDGVAIHGSLHFDGDLIERIELDIDVAGQVDADELQTIFRLTERACTISRAVSVPVVRHIRQVD